MGFWGVILLSCLTWPQSLLPSWWGPLPSGILHRELHLPNPWWARISPQWSSLRRKGSPQGGWSAQGRGGIFSCLLEKVGLGDEVTFALKTSNLFQKPSESSCLLLSRGKLARREGDDRSRKNRPHPPSPFLEDLSLLLAFSQTHRLVQRNKAVRESHSFPGSQSAETQ